MTKVPSSLCSPGNRRFVAPRSLNEPRGLGHRERVRHTGPVTPGACVMRASRDHLLLAVLGAGAVTSVLGAGVVPGLVTPAGMVVDGGAAT